MIDKEAAHTVIRTALSWSTAPTKDEAMQMLTSLIDAYEGSHRRVKALERLAKADDLLIRTLDSLALSYSTPTYTEDDRVNLHNWAADHAREHHAAVASIKALAA
jgi:hypothetical protein